MLDILTPKISVMYPGEKPEWVASDNKPKPAFAEQNNIDVRHVTICSVSPINLVAHLRLPGGAYRIPPVPKGEYRCLKIHDTIDVVRNLLMLASAKNDSDLQGQPQNEEHGIPCDLRARDILDRYTKHFAFGELGTLGVALIAGDTPTAAEFYDLIERQASLATRLINQADQFAAERKFNDIMTIHRVMLSWIGDFDEVRHPWSQEVKVSINKKCVACAESIKVEANVCPKCGTNLLKWYVEQYDAGVRPDPASESPIILNVIAKLEAAAKAAKLAARGAV